MNPNNQNQKPKRRIDFGVIIVIIIIFFALYSIINNSTKNQYTTLTYAELESIVDDYQYTSTAVLDKDGNHKTDKDGNPLYKFESPFETQVATAAPTTPSAGKPKYPKINTKFNTPLINTAVTPAFIGTTVSPHSRKVLVYTCSTPNGSKPKIITAKYCLPYFRAACNDCPPPSSCRYKLIRFSPKKYKIIIPTIVINKQEYILNRNICLTPL